MSTMPLSHDFEDAPDTMFDFNHNDFISMPEPSDPLFGESLGFGTHFEPINEPAPTQTPNLQTVSPKDLMVETMSAPPSGAYTDLTTPGTSAFDSPYMASTETSPLFAEDSFTDDPDKWPSLFEPIEEQPSTGPVSHFADASPPPTHTAPVMSRNGSSPGLSSSRSSHQGRHSFTSGVAPKRRDKPLPAITVEDLNDTVAVKRARNTMAARKSREKRIERTEQLVNQVTELEAEVEHWKNIAISMGHVE